MMLSGAALATMSVPIVVPPPGLEADMAAAYARLMEAHATGPIACPRALLFVTARNLALNHLRHQRIERPEGAVEIATGRLVASLASS